MFCFLYSLFVQFGGWVIEHLNLRGITDVLIVMRMIVLMTILKGIMMVALLFPLMVVKASAVIVTIVILLLPALQLMRMI